MTESFIKEEVIVGRQGLEGVLRKPREPRGLVIFAHGSGSSRLSPRNNFVAGELSKRGFASLLFDLLTEQEAQDRRNVFDIALLGERVVEALEWATREPALHGLPIGLFGASTGGAAALVAAAARPALVGAVVSRGGRPDLAERALPLVKAPTLLIVGGLDDLVIQLNQSALLMLQCAKRLDIVPGATHLFEEPGTLETVVSLAIDWFDRHLRNAG
ncbi:dienelactone hydrolase family protein [Methylocystis iwaonis]|uniref:Dienelactone hydrolase domain-containing protein n=1 Tax=Methylocystis iwaonis TaxID=2885079 RepID=A0ABM8EAX5_9HYPH|nr:alpha/beta family hydrolase [Methylocystis iwaonis]BDV35051.1 hypothetical protein SS37A_25800 [Methylocystis iwaonis]